MAGLLRSTDAALLTSLTTYGLAAEGSRAYEKTFGQISTPGADISTRRIAGIGRSAKLGTLHMAAGLWAMQNQNLPHVALLLTSTLAGTECTLANIPQKWLGVT